MVDHHVVAVFVNFLVGILVLKTVQQVVELLGFLAAAGLFKEVLLGLHGTHAVLTRQTLGAADGVDHFNGLVPHLQIAKGTGVHQEHLDLGSAMQLLALIGQRQFHGLLRFTDATLAVSDERQVVEEAVHTVGGAELTQGQLVVALTVGHERERLTGEVDAGCLTGHPLGVLQGKFGVALLQRESGEDVQTNVLRMFLGQAAQTFALILGQHRPFHALGHLGLVGTTVGVRVLRGEAHRAVGVTARTPHVFRALLLTVLALLFLRKLAEFAVTTVVVAAIVTAEVTTIIAAVVPAEVAAVAITAIVVATEVATLTIAVEITAIVIPAVIATEVTTVIVTTEITTVPIATVVPTEISAVVVAAEVATLTIAVEVTAVIAAEITTIVITVLVARILAVLAFVGTVAAFAARLEAFAVTARTIAAVTTLAAEAGAAALVEAAGLAVRLAVAAVALAITVTARRVALAILTATRLEALTVMTRLETALATRLETLAAAVARSAIAIPLMAAAVGLAGTLVTFCHYLFSLIRC